MKKVRVISYFVDKFDRSISYKVGSLQSFDDDRAADMVERHLAEYVEEDKAANAEVLAVPAVEEPEPVVEPEAVVEEAKDEPKDEPEAEEKAEEKSETEEVSEPAEGDAATAVPAVEEPVKPKRTRKSSK